MKASIGLRIANCGLRIVGTAGRTSGWSDHQFVSARLRLSCRTRPAGQLRTGGDPVADRRDFLRRQRRAALGHLRLVARDVIEQQALGRLARHENRAALAASQELLRAWQRQAALLV